eukprot:11214156-Lingulodinium_polyedra.AAC.1
MGGTFRGFWRRARVLARALERAAPGRAVLFTFDAAQLHLALPVIQVCRRRCLAFHSAPTNM